MEKYKVTGYTFYKANGKGEGGIRGKGLPEENNVKIEVILKEKTLEKIVKEITKTLFLDFIIIYYVSDVKVARIEKYV